MTRWLPILTGCALLGLASAAPAASLEARLVRAANETAPADDRVADIVTQLTTVFGYDHYRLLGRRQAGLVPGRWVKLNIGEGFSVLARSRPDTERPDQLEFEVYSGKVPLTKATVSLARNTPMLIRGPEVGSTLMIIALTRRE